MILARFVQKNVIMGTGLGQHWVTHQVSSKCPCGRCLYLDATVEGADYVFFCRIFMAPLAISGVGESAERGHETHDYWIEWCDPCKEISAEEDICKLQS